MRMQTTLTRPTRTLPRSRGGSGDRLRSSPRLCGERVETGGGHWSRIGCDPVHDTVAGGPRGAASDTRSPLMARQTNVGTQEHTAAQEVADRYEISMEDGTIDEREDRWIRSGHRESCKAAAHCTSRALGDRLRRGQRPAHPPRQAAHPGLERLAIDPGWIDRRTRTWRRIEMPLTRGLGSRAQAETHRQITHREDPSPMTGLHVNFMERGTAMISIDPSPTAEPAGWRRWSG